MKAAYITETGAPDVIRVGDLPDPVPAADQALVRVRAVAVNPIDTYIRSGVIPATLPIPYIIGADLAGVVEAVGPAVTRVRPGDRVWCTNQSFGGRQGTFAELAAVDEQWPYPIPEGIDEKEAVALALTGVTAHLGLFRDAGLRSGETLFVPGGTGGVGSAVVQMGRIAGARVITTAGSAEKARRCRELGAEQVILHNEEDIAETVRRLAPAGVNVWYETRREPPLEQTIPLLAPRGRMIVMAGRDARPPFPLGSFYTRDCKLFGFAMFNATPDEMRRAADDINRWLGERLLRANIDRVLPLSEAAEAHRLQEESTVGRSGALGGKIVLTVP